MRKFEVLKISGIVTGVGFTKKVPEGEYSETICETLFITGDDKKDAKESKKWAKKIAKALNKLRKSQKKKKKDNDGTEPLQSKEESQ